MGLFAFLLLAVMVVIACGLAVYAMGYFSPDHPKLIDKGVWGLGIFIILYILLSATGILSHDIMIPRVR